MSRIGGLGQFRIAVAALSVVGLVAIGGSALAAPSVAAGNSVSVSPSTTTIAPAGGTGGTFSVNVTANGSVDISGAGAALDFDKTRLQVTVIAKDATEVANGVGYAGFPGTSTMASFIAAANASGRIPTIAWTYTDGSSAEAAGSDHGIFSATFQVIAPGDSTITPSSSPASAVCSTAPLPTTATR